MKGIGVKEFHARMYGMQSLMKVGVFKYQMMPYGTPPEYDIPLLSLIYENTLSCDDRLRVVAVDTFVKEAAKARLSDEAWHGLVGGNMQCVKDVLKSQAMNHETLMRELKAEVPGPYAE